ncbi:glycoside hydrolase family 108 protein [Aliidiomarina sp. Khilg15.8]
MKGKSLFGSWLLLLSNLSEVIMGSGPKDAYERECDIADEEQRKRDAEFVPKASEPVIGDTRKIFLSVFERVIGHEGGYANHPDDPGGETNWGITKRVARAAGYQGDMKALPRELARDIYYREYWQRAKCDQYHPAIGFQLFDIAVNHGIGTAIRMLQRAAEVADDGIVGPVTLKSIKGMPPGETVNRLNAERLEFYAKLTTWDKFGRGWANRVAGNLRYGAEDSYSK